LVSGQAVGLRRQRATASDPVTQGPRFGPFDQLRAGSAVLPRLSRRSRECPETPSPHSKRSVDHRFCGPRLFRTEHRQSQMDSPHS
jgi:hypothetical protein